ncbi:MAG: CHAD domain-containing protein [Pseudooceanicola sp.]|nr:CHAD domain-containing protein [Pseudooceanicola sp.]
MESFDPGQPLAVSLRAVALTHLDAAIESARAIATEPGPAIHAVRKRIKQLRGLLRLVRPGLGDRFTPLDDALRAVAHTLAPLREAEVLVQSVALLSREAGEPFQPLQAWAAKRLARKTAQRVPAALSAATLAGLEALRERVPAWHLDGDDTTILATGLARPVRQCRKGLETVRARRDIEALHDLRRQVKYHGMHCALLAPALPRDMAARIALANRIGDALGTDHDLADLVNRLARGGGKIAPKKTRRRAIRLARGIGKRLQEQAIADARILFRERPKALARQLDGYPDARLVRHA